MAKFEIHTPETAPEGARGALEASQKQLGFVPSLYGVLAENPAALEAYQTLGGIFAKTGLTPLEQQVVTIAASVENECHFCVAAHTAISVGQKLDQDVIHAIRDNRPIADAKLEALRVFSKKIVIERGFVSDADVEVFLEAGYTQADVLAVIIGVSLKTISNYTNHVAETPVNEAFQAYEWTPPQRAHTAE